MRGIPKILMIALFILLACVACYSDNSTFEDRILKMNDVCLFSVNEYDSTILSILVGKENEDRDDQMLFFFLTDRTEKIISGKRIISGSSKINIGLNDEYLVCENFSDDGIVVYDVKKKALINYNTIFPVMGKIFLYGDYAYGTSSLSPPAVLDLKTGESIIYENTPFIIGNIYSTNEHVYFYSNPVYEGSKQAIELFSDGTWQSVPYNENHFRIAEEDLRAWDPQKTPLTQKYHNELGIPLY